MTVLECSDWLGCLHEFGMISSNYGSLVAALFAALIFFIVREISNRGSYYSGTFYVLSETVVSRVKRYEDLNMFFTFIICSDGYVISGTCEKTAEIVSDGEQIPYHGGRRKRGIVTGHVERNYIFNSVMHLHIIEEGRDRNFSTYMAVTMKRLPWLRKNFRGDFYSTAGDSQGVLEFRRMPFDEHPKRYKNSKA